MGNGWINGWRDGGTDKNILYVLMNGSHRQTIGLTNRWMEGQMDGRLDGIFSFTDARTHLKRPQCFVGNINFTNQDQSAAWRDGPTEGQMNGNPEKIALGGIIGQRPLWERCPIAFYYLNLSRIHTHIHAQTHARAHTHKHIHTNAHAHAQAHTRISGVSHDFTNGLRMDQWTDRQKD